MRRKSFLAAFSAALLLPAAAVAQVDTSEWKCEYCPFEQGYSAEYSVGALSVSDDAARFGNGTGLDEEGVYADLNGQGRSLSEKGTETTWYAEDLGLDSRVFTFGIGRPGRYGIDFGYSELPYRRFDDTETPFTASGDVLSLPNDWVPAATTGAMTSLAGALRSQNIEIDRSILDLGADFLFARNFEIYADYRRQEREGTSLMSGSFFNQGEYLPRPVDDYTDSFDVGIAYKGEMFNIRLAYYGSFYRNDRESLTWDNPFTSFDGADMGRMALEPENDFQQFSLSGAFRFNALDTVLAFSAASGEGEQKATLLPYTINPLLPAGTVPGDIDGQVDTANYGLTLTMRPLRALSLQAAYSYDERDNGTPVQVWERVITDALTSGEPEPNIPYSFERTRLNLSGSWRVIDSLTLSAGWDQIELDRDFQEVRSQTEYAGWGKLRWRPTPSLEATFKGGTARREINDYDTDVGLVSGQNPLMRKYNLAHRYREYAEVGLFASLTDTPISIGLTWLTAEDDYSKSELGLLEGTEDRLTVDFNWAFQENSSLYLMAGAESMDSEQLGSQTFAGPEWQATHDDDFVHYGGGIRMDGIGENIDLFFDYTRTDGETEILVTGSSVSPDPLPDLESVMDSLRLGMRFYLSGRMSIDATIRWERFEAEDWALEGVEPDTIPNLLSMGANPYDYDVWVLGVGFTYTMGADSE